MANLPYDPNQRFGPLPKSVLKPTAEDYEHLSESVRKAASRTLPQAAAKNGCRLARMAVNGQAPRTCERCGVLGPCAYGFGGVPLYTPEPNPDQNETPPEDKGKNLVGVIKSAGAYYDAKQAAWGALITVWTNFPDEGQPTEDEFFLTFDQLKTALRSKHIEWLTDLANHPCVCAGDYSTIRLIL